MSKKAVIDIGSLKTKLAIFDSKKREIIASDSMLTLLGKGINDRSLISPESLILLEDCLKSISIRLKKEMVKNVVIIGTEALRRAKNTSKVNNLVNAYFPNHLLHIVDQHKEAELFFGAVSKEFPDEDIVAMDIGGGSVQIIYGRYDSKTKKSTAQKKHNLSTGTYKLQQQYSPENSLISKDFDKAEQIIAKEYKEVDVKAPILVFGSTCMLDFVLETKMDIIPDNINNKHPVYVTRQSLKGLLDELRTLAPDNRVQYYPSGGYFIYGADYLLLNLIEAIDRVGPERIYPTNLNSSYGFI